MIDESLPADLAAAHAMILAERAARMAAESGLAAARADAVHAKAERAAAMATLIMTAKLNDLDPQAWLADVLARIAGHPVQRLAELLPWNWRQPTSGAAEISQAA